jgi:hypothetical protein
VSARFYYCDHSTAQTVVYGGHSTGNHCTSNHCTGNHCTSNHCTGNHCTGNHCTGNHCTGNHCTGNHCTGNHCTGNHCTSACADTHTSTIDYCGPRTPHCDLRTSGPLALLRPPDLLGLADLRTLGLADLGPLRPADLSVPLAIADLGPRREPRREPARRSSTSCQMMQQPSSGRL